MRLVLRMVSCAALGAALFLTSTASANHRQNIVEIAQATDDLSILVEAVQRAGLADELSGGRLTVFAPTNQAFLDLLQELGLSSLDDVPTDVLTAILLDHVVEGRFTSLRLSFLDRLDRTLTPLGGLPLEFDRHPLEVNDIDIIAANIRASNGIVHVIDAVLLEPDPRPSITDLAVATPELSVLVEAATRTGLDRILAAGGPFTVFAPTNDAFVRLLGELGLSSLDDVDQGTLVNILLDHVVARELDRVELRRSRGTRALGRLRLRFRTHPLSVNRIPIVATDIEANNGTVHVIDGVLLSH